MEPGEGRRVARLRAGDEVPSAVTVIHAHLPPVALWLLTVGLPVAILANLVLTALYGVVPGSWWFVPGDAIRVLAVLYAVALAACLIWDGRVILHLIAIPLGVAAYTLRGLGFVVLMFEREQWSLVSAISLRVVAVMAVVSWHIVQVWRAGLAASAVR